MNFWTILVAGLGALNWLGLVYVQQKLKKIEDSHYIFNRDIFEISNDLLVAELRIDELEEMFEKSKKSQPARTPQGAKNNEMFIKSSLFKLDSTKDGTLNRQIVHDLWEDMIKKQRWWKKPDQG